MCRAPLKISLLSGPPVEILQLQLQSELCGHRLSANHCTRLSLVRLIDKYLQDERRRTQLRPKSRDVQKDLDNHVIFCMKVLEVSSEI